MKLSPASGYALTALAYLVRLGRDGPVTSHEIARAKGVTDTFSRRVLAKLAAAGIILSQRGTYGGYCLARTPRQISLLDVIEAADGPTLATVDPVGEGGKSFGNTSHPVCDEGVDLVRQGLARVTLAELVTGR
jgi:Rrf2 family protein